MLSLRTFDRGNLSFTREAFIKSCNYSRPYWIEYSLFRYVHYLQHKFKAPPIPIWELYFGLGYIFFVHILFPSLQYIILLHSLQNYFFVLIDPVYTYLQIGVVEPGIVHDFLYIICIIKIFKATFGFFLFLVELPDWPLIDHFTKFVNLMLSDSGWCCWVPPKTHQGMLICAQIAQKKRRRKKV